MSAINNETETFTETWLKEPLPCEHSMHETEKDVHDGDAEYIVTCICPECGDDDVLLLCEKFILGFVLVPGSYVYCASCDADINCLDTYVDIRRL